MDFSWTSMLLQFLLIFWLSLLGVEGVGNGCTSRNVEELRQLRLEQLKTNILAQLGFTEPPQQPPPATQPPPQEQDNEIEHSYQQLVQDASTSEAKCTSGDFYAKPINSFIGVLSPAENLISRYRRTVKSEDIVGGGSYAGEQEVVIEAGILNQYTISVNFHLSHNLSDISRANLILYQAKSNTIDYAVLDRYQLVQIRTVIGNIRYFVEKKSVDVYDSGLQSFDITRAVELWVQEGVSGNVILEVLVTCYSSPNCTTPTSKGQLPAKVSFVQNTSDSTLVPRIITISKNPLESHSGNTRRKRQAPNTGFCKVNESTCCLQPLVINFANDLGFDFISRPKSFRANFCEGLCPEVTGTVLLTSRRFELLRLLNSGPTSSIEPCCTGIEYNPLQILVRVYNPMTRMYQTQLDRLDQVTVTKCKCG